MLIQGGENRGVLLADAYTQERARLLAFAEADSPQGEYARPVFGAGKANARVLLIGEAPGAEETKLETPFVGKAGKQLDALFQSFGVVRERAYITNVVKYRPVVRSEKSTKNRTPGTAEIDAALPLLRREIELLDPAVLLTLGNTPLKALLFLAKQPLATIGALHGKAIELSLCGKPRCLVPLYHPASGIYNRALIEVMERDAAAAGEIIRNHT